MIPPAFKLLSPLLFDISKSFPVADDILVIIPEGPEYIIPALYELSSLGTIKMKDPSFGTSLGAGKPTLSSRFAEDIVVAGYMFGFWPTLETTHIDITIDQCQDKTCKDLAETTTSTDISEQHEVDKVSENLQSEDSSKQRFDRSEYNMDKVTSTNESMDVCKQKFEIASFAKWPSNVANIMPVTSKLTQKVSNTKSSSVAITRSFSKNNQALVKCSYCDCTLESTSKVKIHVKIEHVLLFNCKKCNFKCVGKSVMDKHRSFHKRATTSVANRSTDPRKYLPYIFYV